jgi:hypothetical protein
MGTSDEYRRERFKATARPTLLFFKATTLIATAPPSPPPPPHRHCRSPSPGLWHPGPWHPFRRCFGSLAPRPRCPEIPAAVTPTLGNPFTGTSVPHPQWTGIMTTFIAAPSGLSAGATAPDAASLPVGARKNEARRGRRREEKKLRKIQNFFYVRIEC